MVICGMQGNFQQGSVSIMGVTIELLNMQYPHKNKTKKKKGALCGLDLGIPQCTVIWTILPRNPKLAFPLLCSVQPQPNPYGALQIYVEYDSSISSAQSLFQAMSGMQMFQIQMANNLNADLFFTTPTQPSSSSIGAFEYTKSYMVCRLDRPAVEDNQFPLPQFRYLVSARQLIAFAMLPHQTHTLRNTDLDIPLVSRGLQCQYMAGLWASGQCPDQGCVAARWQSCIPLNSRMRGSRSRNYQKM